MEFALVAVDRTRVDERAGAGDRRARMVQRLVAQLSFHLSGAQIGITVSSLLLGFMAEPVLAPMIAPAVEAVFGSGTPLGVSVAVALILATIVHMVLGELVPKAVATTKPYGTAVAVAVPTTVYGVLAKPLVRFLNESANWMVRRLGIEPREELEDRARPRGVKASLRVLGPRGDARRERGPVAHPVDPPGRQAGRRCHGASGRGDGHRGRCLGRRARGALRSHRPLAVPRHWGTHRRCRRRRPREVAVRGAGAGPVVHAGVAAAEAGAGRAGVSRPRRPARRSAHRSRAAGGGSRRARGGRQG